jgi:hypothetical protein
VPVEAHCGSLQRANLENSTGFTADLRGFHAILITLFKGARMPKEGLTRLTVDIPRELHRRAKVRAAELGTEIRVLVIEGLEMRLARRPPRKAAAK